MTAAQSLELHNLVIAAAGAHRVPEALLAADFQMEHRTSSVIDHTYRGSHGWRDWMEDLREEFRPGPRLYVEAIHAAKPDLVVASFCLAGVNVHTGEPTEFRWAGITWFAGGKVTRSVGCTTAEEALRLADLGRQAAGCPRTSLRPSSPQVGDPARGRSERRSSARTPKLRAAQAFHIRAWRTARRPLWV